MQGKIIKGIAGFYYVQTEDKLYECKAKGIFRNKKMKPLVEIMLKLIFLTRKIRKETLQRSMSEVTN